MKELHSAKGELLLSLKVADAVACCKPVQYSVYTVFLIPRGSGCFHADFGSFPFKGPALLFSTPLQMIYIDDCHDVKGRMLQFHGDFYCIEFHREEVSCNGLLFNNIYLDPVVVLSEK
jgi:AraC family transcriptional activator of pobA